MGYFKDLTGTTYPALNIKSQSVGKFQFFTAKFSSMLFNRIYKKRVIDKARERQEISVSNSSQSRKSPFSSPLLHKAPQIHADQQEQPALHILSRELRLMTKGYPDGRERANISIFDGVEYLLVDW